MPNYDVDDPRTWPSYECQNEVGEEKTICGCVFRIATVIDVPSMSCPWCEEGVKRVSPSEREAKARARISALQEQRDDIDDEIADLEEILGGGEEPDAP